MTNDTFQFALRLGDDALVLGHRLSEWCRFAPTLEEDLALANLALDLLGQARLFLTYAGDVEGAGRDEDRLAYFREADEYRNMQLLELPNGDFARTVLRVFLYGAFMQPYFAALAQSKDQRLADISAKAVKEMAYHVRHAGEWVIRLGDGTDESRQRMIAAAGDLWPYLGELFAIDDVETRLVAAGVAPDRAVLRAPWEAMAARVFREATLDVPKARWVHEGGRRGLHTEHLSHMLAEMQVLARAHPEAVW
jgi:ring-1,2-phenylacetyl-CoA epoxidase subunit PaaC